MRILFLGLTFHDHVEYDIHEWLAQQVVSHQNQFTFVRQTADQNQSHITEITGPGTIRHYWADFGRNMSTKPWPPHWKRGLMIARRVPTHMAFLVNRVRAFQPDFIYTSQQHLDCFYALTLRKLTGVPHLLHLHYLPGPWLGRVSLHALRTTPYIISISEFVKEGAIKYGARAEDVRVVHNGLIQDRKESEGDHAWLCRTFNLPHNAKVIVSAGRLDPEKRHEFTIQAMARIKKVVPEARLLICGRTYFSDEYETSLKQLTMELGLEDRVIFAGHRADLQQIMESSDIFCLPAINEAFGMVFIEAMQAGLPVVTVDSGATSEIVKHGETGLLSPTDNVEPLADNLIRLLQNSGMSRRLGQAGRELAACYFSGQRFCQDWSTAVQDCYRQDRHPGFITAHSDALKKIGS